jgi:hypothetical protein
MSCDKELEEKLDQAQRRAAAVNAATNFSDHWYEGEIAKLQAENKRLKRQLKNCVCPHCGFGFEQALKKKGDGQ